MLTDAYGMGCKNMLFYPEKSGKYLRNHVINTFIGYSTSDCEMYCYMSHMCQSFNYRAVNVSCEINDSDHFQHPDDLINGADYVYLATKVDFF